jgi:carbonic anhydrase
MMNASDGAALAGRPSFAVESLRRLREGNRRFVQNVRSVDSLLSQAARRSLVAAQTPIAIVLSCSDSRAPAELVFDQGLDDLFVVRVAGNVVAPSLVGSVEFAAANFGTELVVVMGHGHCGVIAWTVDVIAGSRAVSDNIRDIVDRIRPAIDEGVRAALATPGADRASLLAAATRANVRASAEQLRRGSNLLRDLASRGRLVVVGAEYSLETGEVDFFDGVPG